MMMMMMMTFSRYRFLFVLCYATAPRDKKTVLLRLRSWSYRNMWVHFILTE